MRYKIILVIGLLSCLTSSTTTFTLMTANNNSSPPVPLAKSHKLACELIAFSVLHQYLTVKISNLPEGVQDVELTATGCYADQNFQTANHQQIDEQTKNVIFEDFLNDSRYSNMEGHEVRLSFNLFNRKQGYQLNQTRQVYIIFYKDEDQYNYKIKLPNISIVLTQFLGLVCTMILPMNVRYKKFKPFTFNLMSAAIYMFLIFLFIYIDDIFTVEAIYLFQRILLAVFSFICTILYSQDLIAYLIDRNWIVTLLSVVFALALVLTDELCPILTGAFFLNDIIAIMIAGAFIKFIVIRKLKTSIWAIVAMEIFFLVRQFAIKFHILNYDQGLSMRIVPLFLQIPNLEDSPNSYICSAFGTSKIIAIGTVLNYCKRVDLYLSTHFYRIMGCILCGVCLLVELLYNLITEYDLPTMQFLSVLMFYPLSMILMLFFANKRGEWAQIWHGSFYDIAVNRNSIVRSVDFEEVQDNFGKDLLINTASIPSQQRN